MAGAALSYLIGPTLVMAVLLYALRDLGLTLLIGIILAALAPNFGGQNNKMGGMKLAVYAATPIWIAGLLAGVLGFLGGVVYLLLLLAFAFAGYLIYLGCRPLLGVPEKQAPVVAGITAVIWLVLYFVVEQIVSRIFLSMVMGSAMRNAGYY
jgi:hypothetical protein